MKIKGLKLIIVSLILCGSMTMAAYAADKVIIGTWRPGAGSDGRA
jgi:hypothetical protein